MTNAQWLIIGYGVGLGVLLGYALLVGWQLRCAAARFRTARSRRQPLTIKRQPRSLAHATTRAG